MKNKLILFFSEHQCTDNDTYNAERKGIPQVIKIKHLSAKNTCTEHTDYGIKGICHNTQLNIFVHFHAVNNVDNRCCIEKEHTENIIEIFRILEENCSCCQNHSYTETKKEKNN